MSDPVIKELLHNIAASKAITKAAIEQGVLIGRREMKPLIRELIEALEDFQLEHSYNRKKEALVARAKEVLENG